MSVKCSVCGKEIKRGEPIYFVRGLIYKCCSKDCLCEAMVNYSVKPCTNCDDDWEDDDDNDCD